MFKVRTNTFFIEETEEGYRAFEFYIGTKPFFIGTNLLMVWNVSNYN